MEPVIYVPITFYTKCFTYIKLLHTLLSQINWWPWFAACASIAVLAIGVCRGGMTVIIADGRVIVFIGEAALEAAARAD